MKAETVKWIMVSVVVPIVLGFSTFIAAKYINPPIQYVYSEKPQLEEFKIDDYFPLKEGNYWIYKYEYSGQYDNGNAVITDSSKFKMSVNKIYKTDNYKLVDMRGDIFHFKSDPRKENGDQFGLLIFTNKVYYINADLLKYLIDCIDHKKIPEVDRRNETLILFEFPLFDGQKIGDMRYILRDDLRYLTNVSKDHDYYIKKTGTNNQESKSVYKIVMSVNPQDSSMIFVPGLGITTRDYHHKGTKDDRKLKLIEHNIDK